LNSKYYHHVSAQVSHSFNTIKIWINGEISKIFVYDGKLEPLHLDYFWVGTNREKFGDLMFTRHAMTPEEVDYFYNRHIDLWPKGVYYNS